MMHHIGFGCYIFIISPARYSAVNQMGFEELFDSVYRIDGRLATQNLVPGRKVYGEELVRHGERSTGCGTPTGASLPLR